MLPRKFLFAAFFVGALGACSAPGSSDPSGHDEDAEADGAGADDAGLDSDGEVVSTECTCPVLPAACSAPTTDVPLFTPSTGEFQALLADTVACAQTSLEVAIYETTWDCLVDLFADKLAASPDLTLDIVIDDDMCPLGDGGTLLCAWSKIASNPRVTVVRDNRDAYMHHKFVIADGTRVWTGSSNFTENSFCLEANDAIVIEEADIVGVYSSVFARLFTDQSFGPVADPGTASASPYTVYAGPKSPTSAAPPWFVALLAAIDGATTSIDFMIFALTRTDVSDALIAAKNRGVTVRGLIAPEYSTDTPTDELLAAGVDIRVAPVHHKTMIVDGQTVITGTPNWSANAMENNEMSVWIASPSAASAFTDQFNALFDAAAME